MCQPTPRGPNNPDIKSRLNVAGVEYSQAPEGIQKRLNELRGIEVTRFPAATAMLLRSILESIIKEHYAQRGRMDVSGTLAKVGNHLFKDYGARGDVNYPIQLLLNRDRGKAGTGGWFNMISHSPNIAVDGPAVHKAWQELMPLVRFLLRPPSTGRTP
jgi:hypothetical protein